MGSLQNLGIRGSNAAQQLGAQLSRSGGSSNPGVHSHQQGMLGGSGVGSGSSWGTGKKYNYRIDPRTLSAPQIVNKYAVSLLTLFLGGGRLTPTSAASSSSAVSGAPGMAHPFSGGGSGGFPSGFPGQQQNQQQNIPSSSRSTFGMNLINSSSGQPSMSAGTPGLNALSGSFASFSAASATGLAAASGSSGRLFSRSDRSGKM